MAFKRPVWLDCDPGHDDAMAIVLASHNEKLNLLGISTCHGNQEIHKVTNNALKILHLCGRDDVDVVEGSPKPLLRPLKTCEEIHGYSGLDGSSILDSHKVPLKQKAIIAMFEKIQHCFQNYEWEEEYSKKIILICTGTLTNIALLITVFPEINQMIEIVLMGGCLGIGNTGPVTEFNIQCDPEAAHIVFESKIKISMIPLEVTHTALVDDSVIQKISNPPSSFRKTIVELLLFFAKSYKETFFFDHPPLHDPCAVAYVILPQIFEMELLRVDIEIKSEFSAGQTVVDIWGQSGKEPNVWVAKKMNVPKFWDIFVNAIQKADSLSYFSNKL